MVIYNYSEKNMQNEKLLYDVLSSIEEMPATYLREPSVNELAILISGYELAFMQIKGYRLHFDHDFQYYVSQRFSECKCIHWDKIISLQNEEKSFKLFYQLFHEFIKQQDDGGPTGTVLFDNF